MDSSSEFDTQSTAFLDWFKAQPGTQFHPSLRIVDLRDRSAGRGIIATQDIPPDTELFTIPRSIIISEETSTLAKKLPGIFSKDETTRTTITNGDIDIDLDDDDDFEESVPDSWLNLILILLYESLHHKTSKWFPYLSILPQRSESFNTLMFWDDRDLLGLSGSAIPSKIGKESATRMFTERILPVVKRHSDLFYSDPDSGMTELSDTALLERCHIIGSLIMSYAFDLQPDQDSDSGSEEDTEMGENDDDGWIEDRGDHNGSSNTSAHTKSTMGMVPMADVLNADAEFNAHLSHGDDSLTMTSLREIKAGQEVLNYYGPLPNGELLRRYGYTTPKHSRYDVVEVPWSLVKTVIVSDYKWSSLPSQKGPTMVKKILTEIERDSDFRFELGLDMNNFDNTKDNEADVDPTANAGFILERDSGDPDDQGLCPVDAKFISFPEELVDVVRHVVTMVLSASDPTQTQSKNKPAKSKSNKNEEVKKIKTTTLEILSLVVRRRLDQYPTTIQDDENLLLLDKTTTSRARMAIDVRLGEKRLLVEALEWTEGKLAKYRE
ncbi:Ribosomal lysine N-methyltransferase 4 [Knufia peltigerae]|uniref:Ribosomal lysine N-methyltransferase 4 n=1 Tax=Knufia peltigerae TaxID=1002370 RepID=A0AA38Y942_9EURO|nr:Ribosomal lysine N-methyltransferase 4 [Knufia peltigerae]